MNPDINDDSANDRKAKNAILTAADEASVNTLSDPFRIFVVKAAAADSDDISKPQSTLKM